MTQSIPSHDPASEDAMTGLLMESYRKFLQNTDDMMPCRVVSYNRDTNRAVVQPCIKILTTSQLLVPRSELPNIPVFRMGGGGFVISFPLSEGDLGWLKASDRDISLFLQSYRDSGPNTDRYHSFSDAMFFPDKMNQFNLDSDDSDNLVIQSTDGTTKISWGNSSIKMKAPSLNIESQSVTISGSLSVGGLITSDTDVSSGSVTLKTLRVTGVQSGTDESGVPVQ